jgi:hypothetical protein
LATARAYVLHSQVVAALTLGAKRGVLLEMQQARLFTYWAY